MDRLTTTNTKHLLQMKWIPITKEEDCPEKDSSEEYPKQYILRCKNDGGRGDYEVFKVTADEMWLTALGFDYFEYLDEQDEGWVPVEQFADFMDTERNKGLDGKGKESLWNDMEIWGSREAFKKMLIKFKERQPPATKD